MKKHLLLILLPLAFFACQSGPNHQAVPFPTPFVLDEILASSQISAAGQALCPDEEEFRSRPADFYEKGWELNAAHPPVSTGGGIGMTNISAGINIGSLAYEVPEGQTITITYRYLYLGSGLGDTAPLLMRFILLLDEQLVTTTFNGTRLSYYDIPLQRGDEGAIVVDVPPLQSGIHDLILLGISNVDKAPRSSEDPPKLEQRLTLVAGGENSISSRPYNSLKAAKRYWIRLPQDSGISLLLSLDKKNPTDWAYPNTLLTLPLGTPVDFYIYIGYLVTSNDDYPNEPLAREQPFALVMLVDYQQTAFSVDTPIIYGIVSPSTIYARIPIQLLPPQTSGLHEFTVVRITYPGFPMCLLGGTERIYPDWLFVTRVGIQVEP